MCAAAAVAAVDWFEFAVDYFAVFDFVVGHFDGFVLVAVGIFFLVDVNFF